MEENGKKESFTKMKTLKKITPVKQIKKKTYSMNDYNINLSVNYFLAVIIIYFKISLPKLKFHFHSQGQL